MQAQLSAQSSPVLYLGSELRRELHFCTTKHGHSSSSDLLHVHMKAESVTPFFVKSVFYLQTYQRLKWIIEQINSEFSLETRAQILLL